MSKRRLPATQAAPLGGWGGFSLIEVVVALALLAIIIIPLTSASFRVLGRSAGLEQVSPPATLAPGDQEIWTWGARAGRLSWQSGQLLLDRKGPGADDEALIGLWVDGWLVSETSIPSGSITEVGSPHLWQGHPGAEVVVRARSFSGAWGAPFRQVVPGATSAGAASAIDLLVHLPQAGSQQLTLDPEGQQQLSTPWWLGPVYSQSGRLEALDAVQSWLGEPERDLDLYF